MVGLHYLKHTFDKSDEAVVNCWVENPYWQYFCGEEYFRHQLPIDPSQMTRFRDRIGAEGCEYMLNLTVVAGVATQTVAKRSLSELIVDTTVQEKAIAFPTDAKLYHMARNALVRHAKQVEIVLRQSYDCLSRRALMMNGRYAHARQMQRAKREQKRLKTYLRRVIRDVERKLDQQATHPKLKRLLEIAKRIHAQQRNDKNKVYSVHALEVECIAKGKAHKPYEFGVKVGVVSTSKENFVVGMKAFPGNPYEWTHAFGIAGAGSQIDRYRCKRSVCGSRLPRSRTNRNNQSMDCGSQAWCDGSDQEKAQTAQRNRTGDRTHEK